MPGAAARMAGLIHLMEGGGPGEISLTTMETALELASIFLAHALVVYDEMGADENLTIARKIWAWVERVRKSEFPKRDAFNALRGSYPTMDKLEPGFKILAERNYLATWRNKDTGGRPSDVCTANPALMERWS